MKQLYVTILIMFSILPLVLPVWSAPGGTTYQAKIIKPDGVPLEAGSVNFKFTILDPLGSCILYSETFSGVNMTATGGLISFSLGTGIKTYPVSSTTFENVFSNSTPSLSCDSGGPVSYSPLATDIRKIVMQFHDGSGWQTLPAMNINAVPYAMYASEAQKLSGLAAGDFVQVSTVPACATSEALRYTGSGFTCVAVGSGGGGGSVTSGSVISALGYTPADGASVTAVTSTVFSVSSTVNTLSSTVASLSATVSGLASATSLQSLNGSTSGTQSFATGTGGIAPNFVTANGLHTLNIPYASAGSVTAGLISNADYATFTNKITSSAASIAEVLGYIPVNSSTLGGFATISSLDLGSASATGTLSPNRLPAYSGDVTSVSGSAVLNLANSGVTSGVYTKVSVDSKGRVTSGSQFTASDIATALGYTPANSATVASQWNTSGTAINYMAGNVGIGTTNPQTKLEVSSKIRATDFATTYGGGSHSSIIAGGDLNGDVWSLGATTSASGLKLNTNYSSLPIVFSVGNSEKLRILSSGNVGVGTISPITKLHVNGTVILGSANTTFTDASNYIMGSTNSITNSGGGNASSMKIFGSSNNLSTNLSNFSYNALILGDSNNLSGAGGSIVVGSNNNLSGAVSLVIGSANSSTVVQGNIIGTSINNSVANSLMIGQNNSAKITILGSSGNVGIGTTTPFTKLSVSGGVQISMESAACAVSYAGTLRYNSGSVEFCNGSAWTAFGTGSVTSASVISALGYTPADAVNVTNLSSTVATSFTTVTSNIDSVSSSVSSLATSTAASFAAITPSQWNTSGTTINYMAGNVGIGTSAPTEQLQVKGAVKIEDSSSGLTTKLEVDGGGGLKFIDSTGGTLFKIDRQSGASMNYYSLGNIGSGFGPIFTVNGPDTNTPIRIFAKGTGSVILQEMGGNVGIGTTSPVTPLHVAGAAYTSNVFITGSGRIVASTTPGNVTGARFSGYFGTGTKFLLGTCSDAACAGASTNFNYDTSTNRMGINAGAPGSMLAIGGNASIGNGYGSTAAPANGMIIEGNVGIGTTAPTSTLEVSGTIKATDLVLTSDRRAKYQINELSLNSELARILSVTPVSFRWKYNGKEDLGFIAQDIEKVFPEVVVHSAQDDSYAVKYTSLIAPIISSIQKLYQKITGQDKEIESLKAEVQELKKLAQEQSKLIQSIIVEADRKPANEKKIK